jgi:hypothetical protein
MNLAQSKDALLLFVSQWMGTTVPRLLTAFVGVWLISLVVQSLWDKRLRVASASAGILFGVCLVAMALDTRLLHWLAGLSDDVRLRLTVGLLSAMVLGTTLEAIRRARLQERYALLWMGAGTVTLVGAFFPKTMDIIGAVLGTDYTTSILAVLFIFMTLVLFHFSLALSRGDHRESRLAQRCALLEERLERLERKVSDPAAAVTTPATTPVAESAVPLLVHGVRSLSGAQMAAIAVVVFSGAAVLWTGLRTPEPMIGDEITHYYMLQHQAMDLSVPSVVAEVPVGWDSEPEVRWYPHVFGWHYLGALVYRVTGGSFAAVQVWHTLFWIQFLAVAYLFARRRGGDRSYASTLYLILLASLPAGIIFSVAFYQDVPVAAQILTAFYLLFCGRRWWGLFFLLLAMAIKETAFLFAPAFLLLWARTVWQNRAAAGDERRGRWRSAAASTSMAILVVALYSMAWDIALKRYAHAEFYPAATLQRAWHALLPQASPAAGNVAAPHRAGKMAPRSQKPELLATPYETEIVPNHPGDLRLPRNYFLFGGGLIWFVAAVGLIVRARRRKPRQPVSGAATGWLWCIGLSYVIPAAYILRSAPDARFFLPAIPFLLLPLAEWAVCVPRIKGWLALVMTLALLQVGAVYTKVYHLRAVTPALREAITYLRNNPPAPNTIFMCPEGNYRLFSSPHNWYLEYHLREFWKGDNDFRIDMLNRYKVGAIVIKKNLVAQVDERITDLSVYPDFFVRDVESDSRFVRLFDNARVAIYSVPAPQP